MGDKMVVGQIVALAFTSSALIGLLFIYLSLYKKGVKDPTMPWLCGALGSWVVMLFFSVSGFANGIFPCKTDVSYFLSPISTVFFAIAGFRMSRVMETNIGKTYFRPTIITLVVLGVVSWVLLLMKAAESPLVCQLSPCLPCCGQGFSPARLACHLVPWIDVCGSLVSIIVLGGGHFFIRFINTGIKPWQCQHL